MGRELLRSSETFQETIVELEASLARLPEKDRPSWSLQAELMPEASFSRINEAALSQPLCTAIQIALVDLLRIAGIRFDAVVGHSSGEIAAAYAAGFISAYDAIRIAYYRGLLAKYACGPDGKGGAMIAIGVTYQEATELCSSPQFEGRVKLAASNSSSSITLSGDVDAIEEIKVRFDGEKKFARILKIDTAYHSHHMLKCSDMYMQSLRACNIQVQTPPADACFWYSSVYGGMKMVSNHLLKDIYWRENMVGSVLFSQAVQCAIQTQGSLVMALEVGPHQALKAPVQHTFQEIPSLESFYASTLSRGQNDAEVFAEMLGFVWSHLKPSAVNLRAYGKSIRDNDGALNLMKGLPSYEWDHERVYWNESRRSMLLRTRGDPRHELLGSKLPESIDGEIRWVNFLSPNEIPFVNGHVIQGQKVFPAAGYVTMAIEAAMMMVRGKRIELLEIEDLRVLRALGFDDDTTGIETMFILSSITSRNGAEEGITANFACYSCLNKQAGNMVMMASGTVQAVLGACSDISLPNRLPEDRTLTPVHSEPLYASLAELGYNYSGDFKSLSSMRRSMNKAVGLITNPLDGKSASSLLVHPAVLDAMFQTMFVAYSSPYDGRLWSLHLPIGVRRITIVPARCVASMGSKVLFDAESVGSDCNALSGDVDILTEDNTTPIMKVEGMTFKPFSEATATDDSELFSEAIWGVASPDGSALTAEDQATEEDIELGQICERVAYFYYRNLVETVSVAEREKLNMPFHHRSLFNAASEIISQVSEGRHPFARVEWNLDSKGALIEKMSRYPDSTDFNIMRAVGETLPGVVRGETTILEHMTKDGLLDDYYERGLGFDLSHELLSRMVAQIAHRYPRMNILEIGAGTGGSTKKILPRLDRAFSSYTFTDISIGFFEKAQDIFKDYSSRMIFKTLDIEADSVPQGFEDHSYDLVICSNVLHATKSLRQTMANVRRLLKPGGYLVLLEVTNNEPMRIGFVMSGLPGWWVGADDGRTFSPTISLDQWDTLLQNSGFSGVDSATPANNPLPYPASVFATQAVDERITHIRQPLLSTGIEKSIDCLLILGGKTPQTARLAEDLTWSLRKYCKHVTRVKGLDKLHDTDMFPMTTVINLTELDEPIFKTMTEEKWEALKLLFDLSRNVLWVTRGCLDNEPYSNMIVGLCRSVGYELPHLQIQLLDIESSEMPKADLLSEMLLRLQMKDYWEKKEQLHDIVWSTEPEYILRQGKLHVLRMMPSKDRNNRYNSSRQLVTKEADTQSLIRLENQEGAYFLTESRKTLPPVPLNNSPILAMHRIEMSYSLISPIRLAPQASLFLCLGSTKMNGVQTKVIFLSDATTSFVDVPENYSIPYSPPTDQEVHSLLTANSHLLSLSVLGNVPSGSAVVLNDPEPYLVDALQAQATKKGISLTLIASDGYERGLPWVSIYRRSSKRMIKLALPKGPSIFIDCASTDYAREIGSRIRECLPKPCEERMPKFYLGDQASFLGFLKDAVAFSRSALPNPGNFSTAQCVPLKEVANIPNLPQLTTVIDWTSPASVSVKIQPADSANLFFQNKTYLLVGLTRDLGQSLCQWMLTKGAKYVVIASRNPQINPTWLEGLASRGAIVKVMSM
ncbi:Polyketide synthase-nonribosomal peptide synthetase [Lachnellula subtilissima]|uniref:Polyketide synthase-nonribosomal peptide synthetase n=1 Tax=Lachnellula subtilissima TaxID=602034 RepID=A0A8H8UBF2_9HELO|nr:Polyketide synthase-nonribosomal peptide synthetase [Lachnellula subtilissima]